MIVQPHFSRYFAGTRIQTHNLSTSFSRSSDLSNKDLHLSDGPFRAKTPEDLAETKTTTVVNQSLYMH